MSWTNASTSRSVMSPRMSRMSFSPILRSAILDVLLRGSGFGVVDQRRLLPDPASITPPLYRDRIEGRIMPTNNISILF